MRVDLKNLVKCFKNIHKINLCVFILVILLILPWRFSEVPLLIQSLSSDELILNLMPNAYPNFEENKVICEINMRQLETQFVNPLDNESVIFGGNWKPKNCQPKFDSMLSNYYLFIYYDEKVLGYRLCLKAIQYVLPRGAIFFAFS